MRIAVAIFSLVLLAGCSGSTPDLESCTPSCDNRVCGDDGCGGTCGSCDDGLECTNDSCTKGECQYVVQEIYCEISGACAPSGTVNPGNACQACQPATAKGGWSPVEDGTLCGAGKVCYEGACCDAAANCEGKECGSDGCGGECGECPETGTCEKGICNIPCDDCIEGTIRCVGTEQWSSCAKENDCWVWPATMTSCPPGEQCVCLTATASDTCEPLQGNECVCVSDCEGRDCGPDGCGGTCGQCEGINVVCDAGLCQCAGPACGEACCASYQVCTDALECCDPACEGKECGEDGCGGLCGLCEGGDWVSCVLGTCVCQGTVCAQACCPNTQICDGDGNCCSEQCDGKECGANGCGGVCGLCDPGQMCMGGLCPPPGKDCIDGNDIDWDGCSDFELGEFLVNSNTSDWQIEPQVASSPDGSYVVVWASKNQDGDLYGIFGQRYGAEGPAQGPEFQVNSETDDHQERPAIAALAGGGFVVTYESWGLDGSGDAIAAQVFGVDGSKTSNEIVVNQIVAGDQGNPAVTGIADGGFVVVWDGVDMDVDWNGIYGRKFSGAGEPAGDQFALNLETVGTQQLPTVATLANGDLVAAWQSDGEGDANTYIMGAIYQDDGTVVAKESAWNTYVQGEQTNVILAARDSGFVALWQSDGQDNDGLGIVAARFDDTGVALGLPVLANTYVAGDQRGPAAATLAGGGYLQAWASKNQDGSDYGIVVRRADSEGVKGSPLLVNTYVESIQDRPSIAPLPAGGFVVVWQGWEQAGLGYDIYAARFNQADQMLFH
jgi:hypothetical protein